jgi:hypothetical protein
VGKWSASRPGRVLVQEKRSSIPIVQEAGWAPEPVWTQRLEKKSFHLCRRSHPSPGRPIRSQTLLTELPRPLKAINRGGKLYLSSGFFYTIGMRKRCPTNRVRESFVISILEFVLLRNIEDKLCSNDSHAVDELKQTIHETITSIEISELSSINLFDRLEAFLLEPKGGILNIYCNGESVKQYTCSQKCTYLFILHRIMGENRDCFLSADNGDLSGTQADGKSQTKW